MFEVDLVTLQASVAKSLDGLDDVVFTSSEHVGDTFYVATRPTVHSFALEFLTGITDAEDMEFLPAP